MGLWGSQKLGRDARWLQTKTCCRQTFRTVLGTFSRGSSERNTAVQFFWTLLRRISRRQVPKPSPGLNFRVCIFLVQSQAKKTTRLGVHHWALRETTWKSRYRISTQPRVCMNMMVWSACYTCSTFLHPPKHTVRPPRTTRLQNARIFEHLSSPNNYWCGSFEHATGDRSLPRHFHSSPTEELDSNESNKYKLHHCWVILSG